jgi:hypothetical protein
MNEATISPSRYNSPIGEIYTMPEKVLPPDDKRMAIADAARLIGCSTITLQKAARNGVLPTAEMFGHSWTVEYGAARNWWNRQKHPGGRPVKPVT